MFIDNKYKRIYDSMILRGKTRIVSTEMYVERHHILPKSMGGSNSNTNLVKLTGREHYIAHQCLVRCTEGSNQQKMIHAAFMMSLRGYAKKSRLYESLRQSVAISMSTRRKSGQTARKDYTVPIEVRRKISQTLKEKGIVPPSRKNATVVFTEEHRLHLSQAQTGQKRNEVSRKKQSESRKGLRWRIENGSRVFYREVVTEG
jgi:hypothetical protein